MVPTAGVLLAQVPPAVALLSVVFSPSQTVDVPEIDAGNGCTVNIFVAKHPVAVMV